MADDPGSDADSNEDEEQVWHVFGCSQRCYCYLCVRPNLH